MQNICQSCHQDRQTAPPCVTARYHTYQPPSESKRTILLRMVVSPPAARGTLKKKAIALRCDLVGVRRDGQTAPWEACINLAAVDFLTNEVLLDHLIKTPDLVHKFRTPLTGISASNIGKCFQKARNEGKFFHTWETAREALRRLIDANTIIVGHGLQPVLEALGMIHLRIVDTKILLEEQIGIGRLRWFHLKRMVR
jgi:hypothetical protein